MGEKMKMRKIGQVSVEYMILVGFLVVITIPLILVYNSQYKGTNQQITSNQADQLAQKIVDTAESIYYLGEPSKTTIKVYMPNYVQNITLGNGELVFYMDIAGGKDEVVKVSDVPINGTIDHASGIKYITMQSVGSYVNITSR